MNLQNVPHIFNYNKIDDCRLSEGRVSIPFAFQLSNPNVGVVPVPNFSQFQGDYFLLDMSTINAGVKSLSAIKSLEIDVQFAPSVVGGNTFAFSSLSIFVQDSQQFFSFKPNEIALNGGVNNAHAGFLHTIISIISNSPTKIWFILSGLDLGSTNSFVNVQGVASNFEREPYTYQSIS